MVRIRHFRSISEHANQQDMVLSWVTSSMPETTYVEARHEEGACCPLYQRDEVRADGASAGMVKRIGDVFERMRYSRKMRSSRRSGA